MTVDNPQYQAEILRYHRMPRLAAILALALAALAMSVGDLLLLIFSGMSLIVGVFWLLTSFYVATKPLYPYQFIFLEPFVWFGLILSFGGLTIIHWSNGGFIEAAAVIFQVVLLGIVFTAIFIFVTRLFFR